MNTGLRHEIAERWSAVACVTVAAVLWVGPWLVRMDLFYDDASQHIFWLYQYADSGLFPGDVSVDYFKTSAPWGYRALYFVLAPILDAQLAAEAVALMLLVASCLLVWRVAACTESREPRTYALLSVVAMIALLPLSQQKDVLPTIAFQRAFSLPLLLMTLWALVSRRFGWVGASWLAAALVYPVVLPIQGLAAAVVFLRELAAKRKLPPWWILNAALGIAAILITVIGLPMPPEIGPAYTYKQAMLMPEFGLHGRLRMYEEGTRHDWLWGSRTGFGWPPRALLLIGAGAGFAALFGRLRCIPFTAWVMAGFGIGLWAIMRLFPEQLMFGLYLPNRHPKWALAVFGAFAIAAGAAAVLGLARQWWLARFPERQARFRYLVAFAAPLVVAASLLPTALTEWNQPVDTGLEEAYSFISKLPKDTLVAAHPDLGDFVPLRTRRSVLASTETSMAWMQGYYAIMKPRVEASLSAAYATRIEDVDAALEPFGVDVVLSGPSVWEQTTYYAPFDELVQALLARGRRDGFVLRDPPADRVLFRSGGYVVVRVGKCGTRHCR